MPGPGLHVVGPGGQYPPQGCSLAKLQQLTNGIMELPPESQMTPPPNLTTPPPVSMTPPPGLMRSMTTPPVISLQQQMNTAALMGGAGVPVSRSSKYPVTQQRPSSTASSSAMRKSPNLTPNVTVTPNMTFSPNVAIQPGTQLRYPMNTVNMFNGYARMQQPMMNPGYLNASFLQLQSAQPGMPMQMGMMNVNMHPQQFQQQMQQHPAQTNQIYPGYGYNIMNMNMNMRR
jgi:histone acetyltransferase MYST4